MARTQLQIDLIAKDMASGNIGKVEQSMGRIGRVADDSAKRMTVFGTADGNNILHIAAQHDRL